MSHLISGASACRDITNTAPVQNVSTDSTSMYPGLQISGNNIVNVYLHSQAQSVSCTAPPSKRRRAMIAEDSDED